LRAERRLRLLEELADIGMELARALKPHPEADETAAGKDPAVAFAPLSRAIRLTLALEAKTDAELCLVLDLSEAECGDSDRFAESLQARLVAQREYRDCRDRPVGETVDRLCRDLGLTPDWTRWDGHRWDADYAPELPRYSPFNDPDARPLLE